MLAADRPREAQALLRAAADGRTEMLGPEHPRTMGSVQSLRFVQEMLPTAAPDAADVAELMAAASLMDEFRADEFDSFRRRFCRW